MTIHKNDIDSLNQIKHFLRNDDNSLNQNKLRELLRQLLGHELCELITNRSEKISLSDVKTDLKYFIELIESQNNKENTCH